MAKRIVTVISLLFCFVSVFSQSAKLRIHGYIYDAQTKETLIGATIYDPFTKKGTTTNAYGFYSYTTTSTDLHLEVSFVGYQKQEIALKKTEDTTINVYLEPSTQLEEVVIRDNNYEKRFVVEDIPGKMEINPQIIAKMPTLTGESDLLKAIQMLPGVKSGTEGTTGLHVRGGNSDQNLYLIDGIEVYNPNHLMGFISAFNTDAIKNIDFYKGGFPSSFGGRVSSVMDIRTKDGNNEKIKGEFSIGLISAKLNIEGPIIKDKTTFSVSARRTYLDLLIRPLLWYENKGEDEKVDFKYHFSDLNIKIKHRLDKDNTLTASFYMGEDTYGFSLEENLDDFSNSDAIITWGNMIATIDFSHKFSSALFGNFSLSYNRYKSNMNVEYDEKNNFLGGENYHDEFTFNSGVEDFTLKNNYNYYLNGWNSFNFGVSYTYHHYTPEVTKVISLTNGVSLQNPYQVQNIKNAHEMIAYVEDVMNFTDKFSIREGMHYDFYNVEGVSYHTIQPRLNARYSFFDNFSVKGGYAMMNQNIHLLSNGMFSLPSDLWVPVTKKIKPITSHQISMGAFAQTFWNLNISAEAYYKWLNNVIDYKDGIASFNNSEKWEENVAQGDGKAYGLEFSAQKTKGIVTGWAAYTISWSKRKYEGGEINNGEEFYDRFDIRHQFNIVLSYKINDRWDITSTFVINSGARCNIPIANYYNSLEPIYPHYSPFGNFLVSVYGDRNNFRLPSYHRLDLSLINTKKTKHGKRVWIFNIYNAYNHKNAFFVFASNKPNVLKAFSIMPIIPTISYCYKFH